MIDVKNKACIECSTQACYNFPNQKPGIYCGKHYKEGMVDIKHKKCKICNETRFMKKYNGHCLRCFIHLFPDQKITRNYKIKENHVFDALLELLPKDINYTRDKKVKNACSRRRPDLMIDLFSHVIIAENDENSHKDYDISCENKRIMELSQDVAYRPIIFIRFNCDKYNKEKSLFKVHKRTGVCIINNKKKFDERIKTFAECIFKHINSPVPEKTITTEYLFYDTEA